MNWTLAENKYSKFSIIILFLFLYNITEFLIVNVVRIELSNVNILIRFLIAIPTLILHECIHYIVAILKVENKGKIWIGKNIKKLSVYVNVDGEYNFISLVLYTILPFTVLTVVLSLFLIINNITNPHIWIVVFYNSFMSVMDIRNVCFIIKNYNCETKFKIEEFYLYYGK